MALNSAQIWRAWEGLIGAETRAMYFGELASRANRFQRTVTFAMLLLSSGSIAAVVEELGRWVQLAIACAMAALSCMLIATQNQKRAVEASDLHARWTELAAKYEAVWENIYADDALVRLDEADAIAADLGKPALHLPHRRWLLGKCMDLVVAQWRAREPVVTSHAA